MAHVSVPRELLRTKMAIAYIAYVSIGVEAGGDVLLF